MIRKPLFTTIGALLMWGSFMAVRADIVVIGHTEESVPANHQYAGNDDWFFECTTCATGFRGSEDLGNGLQAIFKLDSRHDINAVTSDGVFTGHDQWLGTPNSFGQFRAGAISIVYQPHGAVNDPGRAVHTARRYDNANWRGLKFAATYTLAPDSNPGVSGKIDNDNGYGAGISYENAGIQVFADYITNDTGDDDEAYKFGGKVTFNNLSLMGQYAIDAGLINSKDPEATGDGTNTWSLGGTFTLGNNMLFAGYGRADGDDLLGNYSSWTLAGTHSMSRRTKVYAGFNSINCDNPDTSSVCSRADDKGGEDQQFSLGMKHNF